MIGRLIIAAFACLITSNVIPEADAQSARAFLLEQAAVTAPISTAQYASVRLCHVRGKLGPDPSIVALVDRAADDAGIPRQIMQFHVQHESGYQIAARNPKSTATGLLQVIKSSHEAIAGRRLTLAEHVRLMSDPAYALKIGAAHIAACRDLMPGASAQRLWTGCHIRGHAAAGGRIEMAARYFRPDANGWLARGSVAMPWAVSAEHG